jgi:hypothetical protein
MEKFDRRVAQWFIDGKPEEVDPKEHRLADEAYVHVGYDEGEAEKLLQRVLPEAPPSEMSNAAKQAAHLWDSLSSALSRSTPIEETLGKVAAALTEVGEPTAMTMVGLYVLARDSTLREAAIRRAIPHTMRAQKGGMHKFGDPAVIEEAKAALQRDWDSGCFYTKTECIDRNYEALGLKRKTAEEALRNRPDPNPWPVRTKK